MRCYGNAGAVLLWYGQHAYEERCHPTDRVYFPALSEDISYRKTKTRCLGDFHQDTHPTPPLKKNVQWVL